jgi:hypothetical protein
MSALNNDMQIIRINVHIMLHAVVANGCSNFVFHLGSDCVFGCVHMSHLGFLEAFGELVPCFGFNVVVFSYIQAPDSALWLLQNFQKVKDLIIAHAFVKVLFWSQTGERLEDIQLQRLQIRIKEQHPNLPVCKGFDN